jgi:methylenetetrahydrofolate dehydrogenase (NADP+) / methenyltetrahydrofolate cyclohydrolase
MAATVIDGKAIAQAVRAEVKAEVAEWVAAGNRAPGLATVLVGDDPASAVYVGGKQRASAEVGIEGFDHRLDQETPHEDVERLLRELNEDPRVSGILLQLPTPPQVDGPALSELIDPAKDVDGLTPISAGLLAKGRPGLRPCTPSGIMELLERHDVALEGAEAVVVGRSDLVGKPVAALLLQANATVTVCHSRTRDLRAVCARADILIAAVGRPRIIERNFVKPGAIVIDVGMNRLTAQQADRSEIGGISDRPSSGLVGDVDFEAVRGVAAAITPVPGGVGPMTIAMLLANTLRAARARHIQPVPQTTGPQGQGAS